jgi:putative flippase GtrA
MRAGLVLAGLYALFGAIATVVNLGTQRLVFTLGHGPVIFALAIAAGTATGLVVKYLLDDRWIFASHIAGFSGHGRRFGIYSATGIVTTAIFWGVETGFWLTWQTEAMRELGGVLGLAIGYVIKYFLDRRFVFTPQPAGRAA